MSWRGHVARNCDIINVRKILLDVLKGRDLLEEAGIVTYLTRKIKRTQAGFIGFSIGLKMRNCEWGHGAH